VDGTKRQIRELKKMLIVQYKRGLKVKKGMFILCLAIAMALCSSVVMACIIDGSSSNFSVAGFYSTSEFVTDDSGNPIDKSLYSDTFMKHVVITYVDNLIDWGEALFQQDTLESVNEAARIYVIANQYLVMDSDTWKWMQNYRVWEANDSVFLYPENWIEPEIGDDKSPCFQVLVSSELVPESGAGKAAFFENVRTHWYADMFGDHGAASVPESSAILLLGSGLAGLLAGRKMFKQ